MKKQYLILIGMILLVGSIIAVGELTPIIFGNKNLDVSLSTADKQTLNEKSNSDLIIGNITCNKYACSIIINRDNKIFTTAVIRLTKDIKNYSEEDFMILRDIAIKKAINDKISQMTPKTNTIQKVDAGGIINIK